MKSKVKKHTAGGPVFLGARIPYALKEQLDRICRQLGMTRQAVIIDGLRKIIPELRVRAKS